MDMQVRPFDVSASFCYYWQRFLVSHGAPGLNPSICRQIFVVERMSEGAAVGPSDRGAAMLEGHSVKLWHEWYDLKFHSRLGQDAVNYMQDWRQSLALQQNPQGRRRATQVLSLTQTMYSTSNQPVQITRKWQ